MRRIRSFSDFFEWVSTTSVFLVWSLTVLGYAAIYVILSYFPGHGLTNFDHLTIGERVLYGTYYSIITATNTGYGDIVPHGLSRLFAAAEAVSGLLLLALFIGKIVSHKQTIAIKRVHRSSFESTFHDFREDLHIVRKDLTKTIEIVRAREELTPRKWQVLRVAFLQIGGLLREVPSFYDAEHHLYRIDARRERLLIEAFHRTLEKLDTLFVVLDEYKIDWKAQKVAVSEVRELLIAFDDTLTTWKSEALRSQGGVFEELLSIVERIRVRLAVAVREAEEK